MAKLNEKRDQMSILAFQFVPKVKGPKIYLTLKYK